MWSSKVKHRLNTSYTGTNMSNAFRDVYWPKTGKCVVNKIISQDCLRVKEAALFFRGERGQPIPIYTNVV